MSVKAGDAPRRSAAHQVSSGSESNGTPTAPPPRTLSISPLQRDDETAELEARVLRLARACAARGRRAARRDRGRSQSRSRSRSQIRRDVPPTMDSDADDERDSETEHASPLRHLRRLAPRAQSGKRVRIEENLRQARCRPRTASWGDAEAARTRRADQCGNQPVRQAGLEVLFTILVASTQRESAWCPRTRRLRLLTRTFDFRTGADARRASRGATRALSSALRMARSYRTGLNRLAPSDDESESDSSDGELFEDEARSAFAAALWDL